MQIPVFSVAFQLLRPRVFLAAALVFCLSGGPAAPHILVTPLRVVLDGETRETIIEIRNQSDRLLDISLEWIELSVSKSGAYGPADPREIQRISASPFLSVAPAQAVIAPDAVIMASIIVDVDQIPDGERRSHLLIETKAPTTAVRHVSIASVPLDMSLGVSIPVLLRGGENPAPKTTIESAVFKRRSTGELVLNANLAGQGAFSPFGAFRVFWRSGDGVAPVLLGEIENVAIYREAGARSIELPLARDELEPGLLEIIYEGRAEYLGTTFDRRIFNIEPEAASQ